MDKAQLLNLSPERQVRTGAGAIERDPQIAAIQPKNRLSHVYLFMIIGTWRTGGRGPVGRFTSHRTLRKKRSEHRHNGTPAHSDTPPKQCEAIFDKLDRRYEYLD